MLDEGGALLAAPPVADHRVTLRTWSELRFDREQARQNAITMEEQRLAPDRARRGRVGERPDAAEALARQRAHGHRSCARQHLHDRAASRRSADRTEHACTKGAGRSCARRLSAPAMMFAVRAEMRRINPDVTDWPARRVFRSGQRSVPNSGASSDAVDAEVETVAGVAGQREI